MLKETIVTRRALAVLVIGMTATMGAQASPASIDAAAAIKAARAVCWEGPGPIPPAWRLRLASGRFDARLDRKIWNVRMIEPPTAPKCPVVYATVTLDGGRIECTIAPCYAKES